MPRVGNLTGEKSKQGRDLHLDVDRGNANDGKSHVRWMSVTISAAVHRPASRKRLLCNSPSFIMKR